MHEELQLLPSVADRHQISTEVFVASSYKSFHYSRRLVRSLTRIPITSAFIRLTRLILQIIQNSSRNFTCLCMLISKEEIRELFSLKLLPEVRKVDEQTSNNEPKIFWNFFLDYFEALALSTKLRNWFTLNIFQVNLTISVSHDSCASANARGKNYPAASSCLAVRL